MAWQNLVLLGMAEKSARATVAAITPCNERATVAAITHPLAQSQHAAITQPSET
ncbi:hypothetical protein [Lancefieldella rimae]|uniref:hypothetical protein n=1 Tax=Lancefieldella rimae TaxID=1383 RepID=UPI00288061D9|nr:hypothetical protein [Lancefieldella rimae]